MKLSIIIPLFNEQESVITVLEGIEKLVWPDFIEDYEIVVVDDCSSDNSFSLVRQFISESQHISLHKHQINMGKGAAVRTGIGHATGDAFLIRDADLELDVADIPRMLDAMKQLDVEFINGSRYMPGILRPLSSYWRYLANRFFTLLTSLLINVKLTDMACGYKLIKRSLYEKLHLTEDRFGFEAELLIKALRIKKNNIAEVPVNYFPRNEQEGKKLRNLDGVKILWTILKFGLS
ncbi:MAG: glycosyltransferase family 2 protein [Bacteroidales bacterium]|nr:glycosyltransferase family 2 protein [Bacteroidales bacterium]MDZ4203536.1 glycosyltransferase family 2 protein [Bacteroidales bacterium]